MQSKGRWAALTVLVIVVFALVSVLQNASDHSPPAAAPGTRPAGVSRPRPEVTADPAVTAVTAVTAQPTVTGKPIPKPRVPVQKAPAPNKTAAKRTPAPTTSTGSVTRTGNARKVTFINRTSQKIWVAAAEQTAKPALKQTGWVLPVGATITTVIPDHWNGRFWGRTDCSFNSSGSGHCATGDCAGKFQCTQFGALPATLAEYNLSAWSGLDFYDVSMVDGSNLPMYINRTGGADADPISKNGCGQLGCTTAVKCPRKLLVEGGNACQSACGVIGGDQYCCEGAWAPRAKCNPKEWPVNYTEVFKKAEPFAYSYTDDDETSMFDCKGRCDYRITFGLSG